MPATPQVAPGEQLLPTRLRSHRPDLKVFLSSGEKGWWEYAVFTSLVNHLISRGFDAVVEQIPSFARRERLFSRLFSKPKPLDLRHWGAIIQVCRSRQYWMLDCHDWPGPFATNLEDATRDKSCLGILKCQYQPDHYPGPAGKKILPWTYFEQKPLEFQSVVHKLRALPRTRETLFFRGNAAFGGRAPILDELNRAGVTNENRRSIRYSHYLGELASHRIALALPGFGNICHREIEGFGAGTPILMPRHRNALHNPLIPDFHYISVNVDTERDSATEVAQAIRNRFHEVKDRQDYLMFVAKNAMDWYDANVRFPASLDLAIELMGIGNKVDARPPSNQ